MRAGPFSDERIIRLANRRFVPFFFDLSNRGAAGDPKAREFLVKAKPQFGRRGVPTPPVFFMTSEGKVVGEISNYASADAVLAKMRAVLKDNPTYAAPTEAEKAETDPIRKADALIDLLDYDAARKLLEKESSAAAHYRLGRLARMRRDFAEMEKQLGKVEDESLAADVRMERAYPLWYGAKYKELKKHLAGFPKTSDRYAEARYHEGLAAHHLGEKDEAMAIWKSTIKGCAQGPWIYRADWAYTQLKQGGGRRGFSSMGPRTSLLNRIGYMGNKNPDLAGPPKSDRPPKAE